MVTWTVQNTRVILFIDIIHYIEILCECVVFHKRNISLNMISRHGVTPKVLEHSKNVKEYPF